MIVILDKLLGSYFWWWFLPVQIILLASLVIHTLLWLVEEVP